MCRDIGCVHVFGGALVCYIVLVGALFGAFACLVYFALVFVWFVWRLFGVSLFRFAFGRLLFCYCWV